MEKDHSKPQQSHSHQRSNHQSKTDSSTAHSTLANQLTSTTSTSTSSSSFPSMMVADCDSDQRQPLQAYTYHQGHAVSMEEVYELASTIGEQFKRLLEQYAASSEDEQMVVNSSSSPVYPSDSSSPLSSLNRLLVPSVVRALELLEEAVCQRDDYQRLAEQQQATIEEARTLQEKLTAERKHQLRYLSEIEEADESWRRENLQLGEYVKYLKGENKRLASSLSERRLGEHRSLTDLKHSNGNGDPDDDDDGGGGGSEEKTNGYLNKRISLLVKELHLKSDETDQLKAENESLAEENAALRNVNAGFQKTLARLEREKRTALLCDGGDSARAANNNNTADPALLERIRSLEGQLESVRRRLKEEEAEAAEDCGDTLCDIWKHPEVVEAAEEVIAPADEERPVQGPIPKEPDFWRSNRGSPNRASRILSFFPRLTRALINGGSNGASKATS